MMCSSSSSCLVVVYLIMVVVEELFKYYWHNVEVGDRERATPLAKVMNAPEPAPGSKGMSVRDIKESISGSTDGCPENRR